VTLVTKIELLDLRGPRFRSFEVPKFVEPNESSENLFELKRLLFLFILVYKCCELFVRF
jgi:hypothetical protein